MLRRLLLAAGISAALHGAIWVAASALPRREPLAWPPELAAAAIDVEVVEVPAPEGGDEGGGPEGPPAPGPAPERVAKASPPARKPPPPPAPAVEPPVPPPAPVEVAAAGMPVAVEPESPEPAAPPEPASEAAVEDPPPVPPAAAAAAGSGAAGDRGAGAGAGGEGRGPGAGRGRGHGIGLGAGAGRGPGIEGILARLRTRTEVCYPRAAARKRVEGMPMVGFCVGPGGDAEGVKLVTSSGSELLDEAALGCVVRGAAPYPDAGTCLNVRIAFELRK